MSAFIRKYRNMVLLSCLLITLTVSYLAAQQRLQGEAATVSLPVDQVTTPALSALEMFRARQDEAFRTDMAALQALCDQENLSAQTREDAAAQLQDMITRREMQLALEGALSQSGLSPCVAVITPGSVTIVTEKTDLTDGESALVLTLAQAHAGVEPTGVRVVTAENAK